MGAVQEQRRSRRAGAGAPRLGRGRRTLLLCLGLFLVVLGSATAVAIGPDDTVELGTLTTPPPAAGAPVVTHEELTAFRHLTLRMTASAPGGVFLAAGHRVDVRNLLAQRSHFELTQVSRDRLDGTLHDHGTTATFEQTRPDRIDGWLQVATPDTLPTDATLVIPLGDSTVDLIAFPVEPDDELTVSLGVVSPSLHHGSWSMAALGLGCLGLWCVATLRARRSLRSLLPGRPRRPRRTRRTLVVPRARRRPVAALRPHAAATLATSASPTGPPPPAVPPPLSKLITVPILGVILLALVLSGCGLPRTLSTSAPALRPPLTVQEASRITPVPPVVLHAPALDAYPLWALAELPGDRTSPEHRMQLLVRDRFSAPWRIADRTRIETPGPRARAHDGVTPASVAAEVAAASSEVLRTVGTRAAASELLSAHVVVVDSGHLAFLRHRLWGEADTRVASVVLIPRDGAMNVLGSRVTEK